MHLKGIWLPQVEAALPASQAAYRAAGARVVQSTAYPSHKLSNERYALVIAVCEGLGFRFVDVELFRQLVDSHSVHHGKINHFCLLAGDFRHFGDEAVEIHFWVVGIPFQKFGQALQFRIF